MGPEKPSRRERERQKRLKLILDKAEELFLEKGFAATTMDDIGKAAEFGRATLYHYFPSKEAIYVAALERAMDSMVDKVRTTTGRARSATRKIEKLKDAIVSFVQQKKNVFHLYFVTRFEVLPYLDEKLAKQLSSTVTNLDAIFHNIYEQGVESGELQPGDPMSMGDIFFSQLIGLMLLKSTELLEPPLPSLADTATKFFIANIKVEKGSRNKGKR